MKLLILSLCLAIVYAEEYDFEQLYNKTGCRLPPIQNGRYAGLIRSSSDSTVHVICNIGYRLMGEAHFKCNESTVNLTSALPECVGCALPTLENGAFLDVSQWFGEPAVYSYCNSGFRHYGPIDHVCNISTGEFSNDNYTCEDINECVELAVKEGDDVRGPCDVNAACTNINGSHICTCNEDYAGDGTHCRHVDHCEALSAPENGAVRLTKEYAHFNCRTGYYLLGKSRVRCRKRKWVSFRNPPFCYKLRGYCTPPPPFENGFHIGNVYKVGEIIRNKCNKDYILAGPEIQTCTVNGWTSVKPHCEQLAISVKEIAAALKEKLETLSSGSSTARLYKGGKNGADLVFMIDRSSSIRPSSLERIRKFVMMIVDEFGVDNVNPKGGGSRVSLVTFGSKVEVIFKLSDPEIKSKEIVRQRLAAIKPHGGETALRPALQKVVMEVAKEARPSAQKALFIIADGQSTKNSTRDPKFLVRDLKKKGFELFVVGVGSLKNIEELNQYASEPFWKHFFILKEFNALERLTERVVLERTSVMCGKGGNVKAPTKAETKAQKGDWPWLGLIHDESEPVTAPICGGAIVCKNWFLTSANCVKGRKKITVEMGVHDRYDVDTPLMRLTPNKIHIHPDFEGDNYDVALIHFRSADTKGIFNGSKPVCLSEKPGSPYGYLKDSELWIAGWGANLPNNVNHEVAKINRVPLYSKLPLVDSDKCSRSFPGLGVPESAFCVGHRFIGDKACRGDIGGPILRLSDDQFQVVGLASRTIDCEKMDRYGMFTEVLSVNTLGWIHNVTNNCNLALRENIFT